MKNDKIKSLREMAAEVFPKKRDRQHWMRKSNMFLDGASPRQKMKTAKGAEQVEQLLGRIKHGVYC